MTELLNIWREVSSNNRFAETKLVFFVGLTLALVSHAPSAPPVA